MVPGKSLVENLADGDKYIHVSYIFEFVMSSKLYKPTYSISSDDLNLEIYPFRVIISMLEGKCGTLKVTEKLKDKQVTNKFDVKRLGFGFPEDPAGPIRILERSTGTKLCELKPMYCTCVKEITKVGGFRDGELIFTSRYIFTQVYHKVNDVNQYEFKSHVIFLPSTES